MAVIQAKVGNVMDFAIEGGVPGTVGANNDAGSLVVELVCSDIDDDFLQLEPCMAMATALAKDIKGVTAVVDLKIFRQQKRCVTTSAMREALKRRQRAC